MKIKVAVRKFSLDRGKLKMRKTVILSLSVILAMVGTSELGNTISYDLGKELSNDMKIVYLDNVAPSSQTNRSVKCAINSGRVSLNNTNTAYVLNETSFSKLDKANTSQYLKKGGVIAVTDNSVNSALLKEKIDTNVIDFDYSFDDTQKGFYVYNNGTENVTINVSAGLLGTETDEDNDGTYETKDEPIQTDFIVDKDVLVNAMVNSALANKYKFVGNDNDVIFHIVDSGSGEETKDTSGKTIAFAFMENYLFLEPEHKAYLCSYTIGTSVVDVMKIKDSNSVKHGIYDISSTFTMDAEPNYAVTDYSVRMKSTSMVIDASYLNTDTSTSVSLGGSIGFEGKELTGSLNGGVSYTYTPDSQKIVNDLSAGNVKYWESDVIDEQLNASKKLQPAIRVLNSNDETNTDEYSRVEEFKIKDNGWWIFKKRYYMASQYRKELKVSFNSNGTFSQNTIIG